VTQSSFPGFKLVDSYTRKAVLHRAFLCLVSSDTPARNAILEFVPPAAFRACFLCWFEGSKYEGPRQGVTFGVRLRLTAHPLNKYANLTRHSSSLLVLDNDSRVSIIGIVTVGV
jgi:hypothetical protein